MANSLSVKVSEDGPRNVVVRFVGLVDTADMNVAQAVLLSSLSNTDQQRRLNGVRFLCAKYAVTKGLVVLFAWNANSPEPMCNLSESGDLDLRPEGGYGPNRAASGYEGSINLSTKGFVPGTPCGFTVVLRFAKIYL